MARDLNDKPVAFKAFRIYPQDLQEAKKILWKLVPAWKRLVHENILPFRGVDTSIFQLALVYAATPGVAGSSRWLAPEIINPPKPSSKPMTASKSTDIFAFAMLAVEVFSRKIPFWNVKNESVVVQTANGKRPAKPQAEKQLGLTAEM